MIGYQNRQDGLSCLLWITHCVPQEKDFLFHTINPLLLILRVQDVWILAMFFSMTVSLGLESVSFHNTGADPGFFLGGGAPLRNDVTDSELKKF